jgi:flagellar biosynthesis protein FlhA
LDNRIPLKVISLSEELEYLLRNSIIKHPDGNKIELNPNVLLKLNDEISKKLKFCSAEGFINVPIICRPDIRLYFRRLIEKTFPRLQVLSYMEITPNYRLEVIAIINLDFIDN